MEINFKSKLFELLKRDPRLWNEETEEFNETLLKDLVDKLDENILELLFNNAETKERFFVKIKNVYVLRQNELKFFIDENKLDNSFTQLANKIGLTIDDKKDERVVLNWPFKDCILEGGMTKEDAVDVYYKFDKKTSEWKEETAKRKEIFFNEILARDEIDRLEDPKAFYKWRRFTAENSEKGEEVKEIKRDENGVIRENFVIKGNNLLALHSLKEEFEGKVKLIYIDPPYNTGNDSFGYNDNFNHSTWLTFMKNRLSIAKELLRNDGSIFVQCDDTEQAYLKVLLDEVFGRENYVNTISVNMKNVAGASGGGEDKKLKKNVEYIHIYAKRYDSLSRFKSVYEYTPIDELVKSYKEAEVSWKYTSVLVDAGKKEYVGSTTDGNGDEIKIFLRNNFEIKSINQIIKLEDLSEAEIYKKYAKKIFQTAMPQSSIRPRVMQKVKELGIQGDLYSIEYTPKTGKNKGAVYEQFYKGDSFRLFAWLYDVSEEIDGVLHKRDAQGTYWDLAKETKNLTKEGDVELLSGKKPEKLLEKILYMASEKQDLVLDYHAGSGTTCAVAHKMGRQWIGIEQLDYSENNPEERMKGVVAGDQTGISKGVKWKGGGDFVYVQLAKWNEEAKEKINNAKSYDELTKIFDLIYEKYFLNYNVRAKEFKETIMQSDEFKNIPLNKQKEIFGKMLDLNQMYINFSERNDKKYDLSPKDIELSEEFYNVKD